MPPRSAFAVRVFAGRFVIATLVTAMGCVGYAEKPAAPDGGQAGTGGKPGMGGKAGTGGGSGNVGGGNAAGGSGGNIGAVSPLLPARIRRLTNGEYDASVRALLGTSITMAGTFPPDSRQGIFSRGGYTLNDAQRVDPVLAKQLSDASVALVATSRSFAHCTPSTNRATAPNIG